MNRAIKFRAWHKEIQKMMDWDELIAYANDSFWHVETVNFFADPELVIMQYIGYNDVNKKELCEEDIITKHFEYDDLGIIGDIRQISYNLSKSEYVGNIYENPELLELL